jgi:peroxiredoxin Q/BCP
MRALLTIGVAAFACAIPARGAAQAAPAPQQNFLAVGAPAPDFTLPGATRYGVLQQPVRLSDYRGDTVVLAFFYRVRGGG